MVEQTPDGVIFADRDGIIRFWNKGAETIFGFEKQEALGQSLDIIIPDRLRERHWEGYRRVVETGQSRYGQELLSVPALKKAGSRISLEFSIALIKDEDGRVLGFGAIVRDVTAKWEETKALKEKLASLEAAQKETS
jgi:PAS domain S-box-containing protein